MIRLDAIKQEVSQMGLVKNLLPGEPHLLVVPDALRNHPLVKQPTDLEIYALRSAILVGEVFPALYDKLEVDFVRTDPNSGSRHRSVPALRLTYIPEGIQDARVTERVDKNATLPDNVRALVHRTSHRAELARALWEKRWPVRVIAHEFGCSKTLIRRDIDRKTLDHTAVARFADQIPSAPTILVTSKQGVHARDRDTEFEFRRTVGVERLNDLKARVEQYAAMCLDGSRAQFQTRLFATRLWLDVERTVRETGVSASRVAVELGYTTSGMRNAIAHAHRLVESNAQIQKEVAGL
ncbi:hypothetical protein H7J87_11875 [Mycolicibacterium wolinskyi]|uniref:Uncharacterized protein n=1 Tax=Mycolicibacterium wolinskyi TaxID=59750 RepID=A0A1X2FJ94_9MYCO|nr:MULTISPECIES: hypothetical protein [Mycolicibacterium]MCV7286029.1 hypothetical protein [Mycolicibacterium wolinskyi]MCV7296225.1 hypothetical protein [Mycolicibacterium goodii]ORX18457.1 hypothetical protein AWC31_14230 [Mycolicibacterium wolinskyi]